jgi:Trypsin-co-occurring domain 1
MTQLTPITLDNGTLIYLETTEDVQAVPLKVSECEAEEELISRGIDPATYQQQARQSFQAIEGTIRAYTDYTLNAFKQVTSASVDKVTLEFGIKVGGEVGIPYVTKGTGESNIKITVECSFPNGHIREQPSFKEVNNSKQVEPDRITSR